MTNPTPGITRIRCPRCDWPNIRRTTDETPFECVNDSCDADFERRNPAPPTTADLIAANAAMLAQAILNPNPGVVYYIRWADRIKIGTTRNLRQRLRVLYHDELLAVEPGGTGTERQRHQAFASQLVDGQTEWFHPSPELHAHIASLCAQHGDPLDAADRWNS